MMRALLKKEWMEFTRNYKLLIICCVFLFFGFSSPLVAKFLPDVLANFLPKNVAESFPEPTALDSWAQFFKNISQLGLFVIVLLFGSTLTSERQSGTLTIFLTKGLKRQLVIYSKSLFAIAIWTVAYFVAFIITYGYTIFYWPSDNVQQLFLAVFLLWIFGIFIISTLILGNILFKVFFNTLLFTAGILVLLFIIKLFPKLDSISIIRLATENNAVLIGQFHASDYYVPIIITLALSGIFHLIAVKLFNKQAM